MTEKTTIPPTQQAQKAGPFFQPAVAPFFAPVPDRFVQREEEAAPSVEAPSTATEATPAAGAEPPPATPAAPLPSLLPTAGENAIDWFAMGQPYFNRGVPQLRLDAVSGIEQQWTIGYNFARSLGLSQERSAWLSNQLTPAAIDFTLANDYPTRWEEMNRELNVSPLMLPIPALHFKLEVNQPGDAAEREADAVAERIVSGEKAVSQNTFFKPAVQPLQRAETAPVASPAATAQVNNVLSQPGEPLPEDLQAEMEEGFDRDLSAVRIHTNEDAADTSRQLQAKAFTSGNNIVFGQGYYQPASKEGRRLLAHELTHVVQQAGTAAGKTVQRQLVAGADLGDGNHSAVTNAATVSGAYQDAARLVNAVGASQSLQHVFVISHQALTVFSTASGSVLHTYPRRQSESYLPLGLWEISNGGGLTRFYFDSRNRLQAAESWTFETLEGFSPGRQQIIRQRGNTITLEDFVDVTIADLQARRFLPAALLSTDISGASGSGGEGARVSMSLGPARPEQWATNQVASVERNMSLNRTTSGTGTQQTAPATPRTPDRLVCFANPDGRQYVNVWVGGRNQQDGGVAEALELHEGESTQQLRERIERATQRQRHRLTKRAQRDEERITRGNIPYNDSTFLGGTRTDGPRPNRPAYRADISGPEVMVHGATGNYRMHLHYEDHDNTLLGQMLMAYGGSEYVWQIINITPLYEQVRSQRDAQLRLQQLQLQQGLTPTATGPTAAEQQLDDIARLDRISQHETVGRGAAVARDARRTVENFGEDTTQAASDLVNPLSSSDGSAEGAVRAVTVNSFNLATLPLHAIMSLGGWLVRSFAAIFRPHADDDREVPFPYSDGVYLIRCVAQPRLQGDADGQYILRLPSVAVKAVQVRQIQQRTRQELDAQEQNLQANILELLVAYRITTDAAQLQQVRRALELRVQEAAQSARGFLTEQIALREGQLTQPNLPENIRQKLNEELEILRAGTQSNSGLLSAIFTRQIALKEQEVAEARLRRPADVRRLERELEQLRHRLGTATAREAEMSASGIAIAKPSAVFVNEADGQTIPLLIEIGQMGGRHTTRGYTMRVSDITSADADQHDAIGATQAIAVQNALREYAGHFPYGRGYLTVRMPSTQNFGVTEVITLRCNPRDTQQAAERLDELLQLLAVVGLFVPGVGVAAMAAGAAVSAARLMNRVSNHTFQWDMNAVMDVLNILGAVAGGVSHLANARLVRTRAVFGIVEGTDAEVTAWLGRLQTVARLTDLASDAVNNLSYFLGTMQTVQEYLEIQRREIRGEISPADARRQRAQLIARGITDQFMQHAPAVVQGMREQRRTQGEAPERPVPTDDETLPRPDAETPRRTPPNESAGRGTPDDTVPPPPERVPEPVPEATTPRVPRPHGAQPPAQTVAQRVAAFFGVRENVVGILRGDAQTTRRLLDQVPNWRDLVMHLQSEPGNDLFGVAIENLESLRRQVVANLDQNFGLRLSDPRASTLASSDIDLATSGADAGQRMLDAEAFMQGRYGPNWSEKLRMNFYTAAERLFQYEQVRSLMSDADFGALQQQVTVLAETLNFAKMLQHAGSDPAGVARVEALMAHLPETQRAEARRRSTETPAQAQQEVAALHRQIDALVARFEALAPTDPARVPLARDITRLQMEANFRTQEAYISPGAGRHVVRGVAVQGHEAYQSALANLEMMEHILHVSGGNVETAIREYELYKYISRFVEAMATAGLPVDAFMLAYYQAAYDVYRNSRTQLQGVGRHDLAWLAAMHQQFSQQAAEVLPRLRQTGTDNSTAWNAVHRSLYTPYTTRTVASAGGPTDVRTPVGIGIAEPSPQQPGVPVGQPQPEGTAPARPAQSPAAEPSATQPEAPSGDRVYVTGAVPGQPTSGTVHVVRNGRESTFSRTNRTLAQNIGRGFLREWIGESIHLSVEEMRGKRVLDVAAGTEALTVQQLRQQGIDAYGMDIALSPNPEPAPQSGEPGSAPPAPVDAYLRRSDLAAGVPFDGRFDIIYELFGGISYGLAQTHPDAFRGLLDRLNPGGVLYLAPLDEAQQRVLEGLVPTGYRIERTTFHGTDQIWRIYRN